MRVYFTKVFIVIFFLISFSLVLFLGTRGIIYSDEGYVLYGAERILTGQVPYKDFHFAYTPFSLYATAISFSILGKSVLAGRILMMGIAITTAIVLSFLFKKITKSVFISLIGIFLYVIWAPLHANFPWPVLFAISLGVTSLYFLLYGIEKKSKIIIVLSGFFAFLVLFTKQNFGMVMLATYVVALFSVPVLRKKDIISAFLLGFFLPGIMYVNYLILSGSFIGFFSDFYNYTVRRIVLEQTLTTPFLLGETILEKGAKFFFYTIPFSLGCFAVYLSLKKRKTYLFLPIFVCFFYLAGIRPTTDYIHLTPLLALTGIPIVLIWEVTQKPYVKVGIALFSVFLIGFGLYSAFYRGYYRWEPPLITQTEFLSLPKTYISLDVFHKDQLERIHEIVTKNTKSSEPIFVDGYIPMFYFITDRKNPTPYDLLEPTEFYADSEREIAAILSKERVRVIITRNDPGNRYLGNYIKKEYNEIVKVNDFILWRRDNL